MNAARPCEGSVWRVSALNIVPVDAFDDSITGD
jgi:hypothetical protein